MRARWFCLAALVCGAAVEAHEIGITRVSVVFPESRIYDIEIVTDAAVLVEKLEISSGALSTGGTGPAVL